MQEDTERWNISWHLVEGKTNVINYYYLHHTGHIHNSLCHNSFFSQSMKPRKILAYHLVGKFCQERTAGVCNRCPLSIIVSNFKLDMKPILLQ